MLRGNAFMQGGLLAQDHRNIAPSRITPVVMATSSPLQRRDRVGFTPNFPVLHAQDVVSLYCLYATDSNVEAPSRQVCSTKFTLFPQAGS
jgi:hypothetical protein